MSELTSVQLFRHDHKLTACALGEPSITLVRNDPRQFGLLLAASAHEDSFTSRLRLDEVSYLRITATDSSCIEFDSAAIFHEGDVWVAQDAASGRYFPNPSQCPYHVVFLSVAEFEGLRRALAEERILAVFESTQRHFGKLPGFSFAGRMLEVPDDYANRHDAVPVSKYVLAT